MKILLIYLAVVISLTACKVRAQKTCKISVLNKSSVKIDSIQISTYGFTTTFSNIQPHDTRQKSFNIQYVSKYEGAFLAKIYVNDSIKGQGSFGYYSNFNDIKSGYYIEILNDFAIKEKRYY